MENSEDNRYNKYSDYVLAPVGGAVSLSAPENNPSSWKVFGKGFLKGAGVGLVIGVVAAALIPVDPITKAIIFGSITLFCGIIGGLIALLCRKRNRNRKRAEEAIYAERGDRFRDKGKSLMVG